jgi:hypothetical protein
MQIGTVIGDKLYVIDYYAEATRYDDYLPIIEEMINSIELSNNTGTAVVVDNTSTIGNRDFSNDTESSSNITITTPQYDHDNNTSSIENQTIDVPTNQDNNNNSEITQQQGKLDTSFLRYETSFAEEVPSINYPSG